MKSLIIVALLSISIGLVTYAKHEPFHIYIDAQLFGITKPDTTDVYQIYLIADGTLSTFSSYAIPQLGNSDVKRFLDSLENHSGGLLLVSHIDSDARDNVTVSMGIPKISSVLSLTQRGDELNVEFLERQKEAMKEIEKNRRDSATQMQIFMRNKYEFEKRCDTLLHQRVYTGSKSAANLYSDVIGTINNAITTLQRLPSDRPNVITHKIIIAFSDLEDDHSTQKLLPIPSNIKLIAINPATATVNTISKKALVLPNIDILFDYIFRPTNSQY